jgi:hypothetical protein
MANPGDVAAALLTRCSTLSVGSPALPVAYPEPQKTFDPPTTEAGRPAPYLRVDLFLNAPLWEGLSEGRIDQGLMQIMVVWPKNQGLPAPLRTAAAVIAHFPKGRLAPGVKISREAWAASPIIEPSQVLVPIMIPWTAS